MEKAINIVGPMKLQNSLLATYLEEAMGIRCEAVDDLSLLPGGANGNGEKKRLILWDCMGRSDLGNCLSTLAQNAPEKPNGNLLGLFNLHPVGVLEEEGLAHGVRGFFYQGDTVDQFVKGIQAIFDGELWLSRKIMTRYILNNQRQSSPPNEQEVILLTAREKEILTLVAQGASNDMISDRLYISRHTVKTHLYNIFKKIHVCNRLQAALWCAKNI